MRERAHGIWGRIWQDVYDFRYVIPAFLIYYIIVRGLTGKFCPMVIVTGLPCPGCGITRAALFLITGQFARAAWINPTIYLWAAFLIYAVIQRYIRGKKVKGATAILIGIALAMIVLYLYRMATVFPNRAPMTITRGSIMANLIPQYEEFLNNIGQYGIINGINNFIGK